MKEKKKRFIPLKRTKKENNEKRGINYDEITTSVTNILRDETMEGKRKLTHASRWNEERMKRQRGEISPFLVSHEDQSALHIYASFHRIFSIIRGNSLSILQVDQILFFSLHFFLPTIVSSGQNGPNGHLVVVEIPIGEITVDGR